MESARTPWPLIALLYGAGLLAAAQFAKISLGLGIFAQTFDRTIAQVSVLVSAVGTVGIVLGVVAGMIVARFGARRMLLIALALGGIVSVFQAFLPPFPVFTLSRVVEGMSHLLIVVAAPTLMARVTHAKDQSVVMALWGTFFGVSFALVAMLLPLTLGLAGLPGVLLAHGAALWGVAAALAFALPQNLQAVRPPPTSLWRTHYDIYKSPRLMAPGLGFVWHTLIFVALLTFVPMIPGAPSAVILPLLSLLGTLAAGVIARHYRPYRIAQFGFAFTIIFSFLLLVASKDAIYILTCLLFVIIGLVPGASFAAIPALNAAQADRARSNGALAQLGNVGTTLGTPLFATVLWAGLEGLLILAIVLAFCGLSCLWWVYRKIGPNP
ncbi:MFS transporter [Oceaniglobus ichthyenteri]|uniref:MFS transporter n=1 Tax=Oceaniglobus ichthyenteri TaxID=2136177 RepID=UPI000D387D9E|nr:MFS transporter [Oceaniglobus ichthyenteri]